MVGPAGFEVQEPAGERWQLAMHLLREGETVVWRRLRLHLEAEALLVEAVSTWMEVTEQRASEDLTRAREIVTDLLRTDGIFADVVGGRPARYELIIDHGMGAVLAATLDGDAVHLC